MPPITLLMLLMLSEISQAKAETLDLTSLGSFLGVFLGWLVGYIPRASVAGV